MSLPGPSRAITIEPIELPERLPAPEPEPEVPAPPLPPARPPEAPVPA